MVLTSSRRFCNCCAHHAIKVVLEIGSVSGMGTRNVASVRSKGKRGSTPCTMKYSESLVNFRIVTCSAQNTE